MSKANSSGARIGLAAAVFVVIGLSVWGVERLVEASDPDLLWRDPASGDDGLKFYRFDPVLGLFHRPSFEGAYQGVVYSINANGLRGPEIEYARDPDRARVLLLGDSLVWGFGVADGQTLADELARAWQPTEVVNLGVAGYGTGQELMLLKHEGLRYQPDLVLLVFTIANDVEDTYFPDSADSFPANLFYLDAAGLGVDRFDTSPLDRLGIWLRHNSYVVAWAASRRSIGTDSSGNDSRERSATGRENRARHAELQPDLARYRSLDYLENDLEHDLEPTRANGAAPPRYARRGGLLRPHPLNHYKVELVKRVLREIDRTTRDAGAGFAIAIAPYAAELPTDAATNPLRAELMRFLEAEQIPFVDLLSLLRARASSAASRSADEIYLDSMHFSPAGNRIVAELLASAFENPAQ
jgi:lysophospholipase L1-like esterase